MAQQTQKQAQKRPMMLFSAGTGVLRSKVGAENTCIISGRMALPEHGQCFIDGLVPPGSKTMVLDVKRLDRETNARTIVATIEMPVGDQVERFGKVREVAGKKRVWKIRGEVRPNPEGFHMALRLPDVKIAQSSAFGIAAKPVAQG